MNIHAAGWMIYTLFNKNIHLTVFQSYQDDGWVIMKSCATEPWHLQLRRFLPQSGLESEFTRSARQHLTALSH